MDLKTCRTWLIHQRFSEDLPRDSEIKSMFNWLIGELERLKEEKSVLLDEEAKMWAQYQGACADLAKVTEERDELKSDAVRFKMHLEPITESVCCDLCCTTTHGYPGRIGTNLLTADEALKMLEYLLEGVLGERDQLATADKLIHKQIACEFFRWWYNQPGSNTDQGFDEWWEKRREDKR